MRGYNSLLRIDFECIVCPRRAIQECRDVHRIWASDTGHLLPRTAEGRARICSGDPPHTCDEIGRHCLVEEIGHGVHEDPTRLRPKLRLVEGVFVEPDLAGPNRSAATAPGQLLIFFHPHRLEPRAHPHRIAVCAAR